MNKKVINKAGIYVLIFNLLIATFPQTAMAALIQTPAVIAQQERSKITGRLNELLARQDLRAELVALGVNPADAQQRVNALTDAEILQLQKHLDKLPAGAGVLEVIGIVFLVLIILELVGVTNVFSKL